jgi:hypothetical protein
MPARPKPIPELLTLADLSRETGIAHRTLSAWNKGGKMPRPDLHVNGRPAWARATVEDFIASYRGAAGGRGRPITPPGA